MASSLIAGAVSLLLIIIAGYVIASGLLMVAETTILAQIDVTAAKEHILQTNNPFWVAIPIDIGQ